MGIPLRRESSSSSSCSEFHDPRGGRDDGVEGEVEAVDHRESEEDANEAAHVGKEGVPVVHQVVLPQHLRRQTEREREACL